MLMNFPVMLLDAFQYPNDATINLIAMTRPMNEVVLHQDFHIKVSRTFEMHNLLIIYEAFMKNGNAILY